VLLVQKQSATTKYEVNHPSLNLLDMSFPLKILLDLNNKQRSAIHTWRHVLRNPEEFRSSRRTQIEPWRRRS